MNKIHRRRIVYITVISTLIVIASGMILYALKMNINVFMTPSQVSEQANLHNYQFRLGGMVKPGSIRRTNSLDTEFIVTDLKREILVKFTGVLPDLFREGKGVIAEGSLTNNGFFTAKRVLAKHDENYMPKNVYERIRKNNEVT